MDITVSFPGGKRVNATLGKHTIATDQPVAQGGEDSAPAPFDTFLASLATCAGIYVLGFCQTRNISTDGIVLTQHHAYDPETHTLQNIELKISLPADFPEKYIASVMRAAEQCKVKKLLAAPPPITVATVRAA